MPEKQQVTCPTRPPDGTHHRKGEMATWAFCRLWRVSDPTLFQMTLVAALLVAVLGKCGPPPTLSFATPIRELTETEFETATALSYTCRPGYSRTSSSPHVVCKYNGEWSYDTFCIKKRCSNPGDLPNGRVEIKTDLSFGSQIEFSCSEGFILKGSTTNYCDIRGKGVGWSDPFPVCLVVKCQSPPDISHGKHNGGNEDFYTYGSSITYTCDPNFSLIGNASISCTVENKTVGVWSPSPPTCERIFCPKPDVPHGIIVFGFGPVYSYKDSIMFNCRRGFKLRGSNSIRCEADKKWNPSPPVCEPICCPIPELENGRILRTRKRHYTPECTYFYEDVLSYICNEQQELSATCQLDGTWSPKTPSCDQVCNFPPTIAHGRHKQKLNFFKYEFVYECDEGYQLVGEAKLSCSDSQWSSKVPQCKALCLKPEIKNGKLSVDKDQYLEMEATTIQCDSGFGVVGSQRITCSENRTWYPAVPECKWESYSSHSCLPLLSVDFIPQICETRTRKEIGSELMWFPETLEAQPATKNCNNAT
ncbi:C4b-binding protein alpha chain isoform X2 [Sciurus carolinensis]|uniref:C4b-binding protein alpha chain isoform X2 n=1 Tax=Sciurus carolinensis TaxID=30640 RepID=UPI001FB268F3|nr:C4b-binding protein alpha chain isoform X2 [Sciurus carolinensis]